MFIRFHSDEVLAKRGFLINVNTLNESAEHVQTFTPLNCSSFEVEVKPGVGIFNSSDLFDPGCHIITVSADDLEGKVS